MTSPTASPPERHHRLPSPKILLSLSAAITLVAVTCLVGATTASATAGSGSTDGSPLTISVGNTSGLTDGAVIPISVTSSDPTDDPVAWVDVRLCRPGTYTEYTQVSTAANCGYAPGFAAELAPHQTIQDFAGMPDGTSTYPDSYVAGVGTAFYDGYSLSCDSSDPCDLVTSVYKSDRPSNKTELAMRTNQITYASEGSVFGCNGTDPNAVQTVGTDRTSQSIVNWSKQICNTPGGAGGGTAPTSNLALAEGGAGGAASEFASGGADLAYTAGGAALPGFSALSGRPYVAVPIGIDAVVVAASGGQLLDGYRKQKVPAPFSGLKITADQAASIFGGGYVSAEQLSAIVDANEQLQGAADSGIFPRYSPVGGSAFTLPLVLSTSSATTDFASNYFTQEAPSSWNSGPYSKPTPYVLRGVFDSFGLPDDEPAFTSDQPYSRTTDLEKAALPNLGEGPDALWTLTDLATADQLGLSVASLGNGATNDTFIAPDAATMDAAVGTMKPEPDGTLAPDPAATSATTTAYPLTFVEYALAPTEPLVTTSCAVRTASEALMVNWLKFVTTTGQTDMAPGMEPLTPSLKAQAASAIAKIGTAAQTGACAPGTTPPTNAKGQPNPALTGSAPAPTGSALPSDLGDTDGLAPTATPQAQSSAVANAQAAAKASAAAKKGQKELASTHFPDFAGSSTSSWVLAAVALLILAALTAGMALVTSGSPLVGRARMWVAGVLGRGGAR